MAMLEDKQQFSICLTNEDPCTRKPDEIQFKLLVPSLKHMASVKLAITLWVQKCNAKFPDGLFIRSVVGHLKYEVLDDASALAIPTLLKKKLSWDVVQVGKEIQDFMEFLNCIWMDVDESLYWTSRGHIDRLCEIREERIQDMVMNLVSNHVWQHRWLGVTKLALINRHHPLIVEYFNSTEDERRMTIINEWLIAIFRHTTCDACFLLAKCSEGVIKYIFEKNESWENDRLLCYFLKNSFQKDYFLQLAAMICDIVPDFDFKSIAWEIVTQLKDLKETPLAYDAYITFYDRFTAVLSRNLTSKNEFAYYYLLLYRWSGNYEQVQSILSHLGGEKSWELLLLYHCDICASILFANGLECLKSCFELGIAENVAMARYKLEGVQIKDICYHYFETNNFEEFSKLLEWLSEGIQERVHQIKKYAISRCLRIFVKKDCRQFVKSYYQKGRYPGVDEMFYHSTDSFLNWIWQNDDSSAVKFSKESYVESTKNIMPSIDCINLPNLPDSKHYNEFNDRMILWMYDNDNEKFESIKNTPQYKIYSKQDYYLTM